MKYDYLVVGTGLFGAVFAHEMTRNGKKCLVIDKRSHKGGNVYCREKDGINLHEYGAHIFHTSDKKVWNFVNQFAEFNNYINSPIANYKGEFYNLPFNMNTFHKMWGVNTPAEAAAKINAQKASVRGKPQNLAEQAVSLVGTDVFEKLIRGYTEKQWGRKCEELPAFIIKRLPVRYIYDNNYYNDRFQGIPMGGYNKIINHLLSGSDVELNRDYSEHRGDFAGLAEKIVYTGAIDEYFGYVLGELEYRGLRFETTRLEIENYQGVAVMNFTDSDTPYTRIIEHKHFEFGNQTVTYVTKEYPSSWQRGGEAYYPVNDLSNQELYIKYRALVDREKNVIFGGRLAEYKYYDMDKVIASALTAASIENNG
ncbi:UDP-galactopyranose mutase [Pectinatus haikarae]|uniref:UDP-galactopyranose mutase n=1 Tax=Pectinatus haikarae TaxID=349096 RepID=UPI0018C6FFAA|nr:UDP-galactopyranose mutase [Pectinatus haikarae]